MTSDAAPIVYRPTAPPVPWTRGRILGWTLVCIWLAALVGMLLFLYGAYDPDKFDRYYPKYLSGIVVTLSVVSISMILGALLSFPIAMMRSSRNKFIAGAAYAYVYFFRGTPLLAQVFLIYYGFAQFRAAFETVGLWWFFKDAWYCGVFALTLNTAAYQAEILAGAIKGVGQGQWEGAAALGISKRLTFFKIILPQALIVALRPYGNELILMLKGSAVLALITVYDLMGQTKLAFSRGYDFQMYIWAALIYLAMVEAIRNIWDAIERRLTRHLIR
jgi:polar amino acid transport system permease protein